MEPVRAHSLVPVAWDFVDAAAVTGSAGPWIGGASIDGGKSRQHPGPVIVIELVGKKECAGKAVILCTVMSIVLVR